MADLQPGALDLVINEVRGGHLVWLFGAPHTQTAFATLPATLSFAHERARTGQVSVWLIDDDNAWLVKSYRPTEDWPIGSPIDDHSRPLADR